MQAKSPKLPTHLIDRHEALVPKLEALARHMEALARERPGRGVPDDLRLKAEGLLCEAQAFRPGRRRGLVGAAPHAAGLAAQLAEALAALIAFEARHTQWDARINALGWSVQPDVRPVRRFAPRPGSRAAVRLDTLVASIRLARAAYMRDIRAKLIKRLAEYKARDPSQQSAYALSRFARVPPVAPPPDPGPRIRDI